MYVYWGAVVILKTAHVSGRNKVRVTCLFILFPSEKKAKECCPEIEHVRVEAVPLDFTSFPLFLYLFSFCFYRDFTFYSVRPFYERCGRGGEGVFNSFPLRKQSDKTKTQPHISFIVSSSSFPSSVYSEYKINTDGIEQSSL